MKHYRYLLYLLLVGGQILWLIKLGYPITSQQITLGIQTPLWLWLARIASIIVVFVLAEFLGKVLKDKLNSLIIMASPLTMALWMGYQIEILKLIFLALVFVFEKKLKNKLITIGLGLLLIMIVNLLTHKEISFWKTIDMNEATAEVMERFAKEDTVIQKIEVPRIIERLAVNKYYLILRKEMNIFNGFWDMETWFFQEIHPLEQKSWVIFVWPMFFLALAGLTQLRKFNPTIITIIIWSWFNFAATPGDIFTRFSMVLWWMVPIIVLGIRSLNKIKVGYVLVGLSIYGLINFWIDLEKRPLFWLDNRPWMYHNIFEMVKKSDSKEIIVSDMVGNARAYCRYYLGHDCLSRVVLSNFDLNGSVINPQVEYIGFVGQYIGKQEKNEFPEHWRESIKNKGMTIVGEFSIRDSIAFKYGNNIIWAKLNDK